MTSSESEFSAAPSPAEAADPRLTATAYHEAGHAVMALLLGRAVHKVTVAPGQMLRGVRLGACEMRKGRMKASNDPLEDEVLILLAGMVAESQWSGQYCRQGASQDLRAVRRLLSHDRAHKERQLERLEQRLIDKTEHLLCDAAAVEAIRSVASALVEKTTLSGRAVRHLLTQAQQRNSS